MTTTPSLALNAACRVPVGLQLGAEICRPDSGKPWFVSINVQEPLQRAQLTQKLRRTHITVQRSGHGVKLEHMNLEQQARYLHTLNSHLKKVGCIDLLPWGRHSALVKGELEQIVELFREQNNGAGDVHQTKIHVELVCPNPL